MLWQCDSVETECEQLQTLVDEVTAGKTRLTYLDFTNETSVCEFVFYAFSRRYGWSAYVGDDGMNASLKGALNRCLDGVLDNVLMKEALPRTRLPAALYSVITKSDRPVVREQCVRWFYEWIRVQLPVHISSEWDRIQSIIVASFADVWSVVRKSAARFLHTICSLLTRKHAHAVYKALIRVCASSESTWAQKEGALLGITTIYHCFRFDCDDRMLLYSMLAHTQLSVRTCAVNALAALFTQDTESTMMISTLNVLMRKLRNISECSDYECHGYLSVCELILSRVSLRTLWSVWSSVFPTVESYLAHSASIVRQTASTLCLRLIDRQADASTSHAVNQVLITCVTQHLVCDWPSVTSLSSSSSDGLKRMQSSHEPVVLASLPPVLGTRLHRNDDDDGGGGGGGGGGSDDDDDDGGSKVSWEWKEGRLLAYDLILQQQQALQTNSVRMKLCDEHSHSNRRGNSAAFKCLHSTDTAAADIQYSDALKRPKMRIPSSPSAFSSSSCDVCVWKLYTHSMMLCDYSQLLRHMLYHVVACVCDRQFELQRMADQVLPQLINVIMQYDANILTNIWTSFLTQSHHIFHHATALLSLKFAVHTCIEWLRDGRITLPITGTDNSIDLSSMHKHMSQIIQSVVVVATHTVSDRLIAVAAEIIIVYYSSCVFAYDDDDGATVWLLAYLHALSKRSTSQDMRIASYTVENWLLRTTHPCLCDMVTNMNTAHTLSLMMIWSKYALNHHNDADIRTSVLVAIEAATLSLSVVDNDDEDKHVRMVIAIMGRILRQESTEIVHIRTILTIFQGLARVNRSIECISMLLEVLSSRLVDCNSGKPLLSTPKTSSKNHSADAALRNHSNDIVRTPTIYDVESPASPTRLRTSSSMRSGHHLLYQYPRDSVDSGSYAASLMKRSGTADLAALARHTNTMTTPNTMKTSRSVMLFPSATVGKHNDDSGNYCELDPSRTPLCTPVKAPSESNDDVNTTCAVGMIVDDDWDDWDSDNSDESVRPLDEIAECVRNVRNENTDVFERWMNTVATNNDDDTRDTIRWALNQQQQQQHDDDKM